MCMFADKPIKIDLHIHSYASSYKEDDNVVINSKIQNLDLLIGKLNENKISLCAITDHNRFDYDLYKSLKEKIVNSNDGTLKNNLPGVEFDVIFSTDKPKCQIIAIFDDSNQERVKEIQNNIFSIRKLERKDDVYKVDEFENIIKKIGISVILIVHQRQSLNNNAGATNSLSCATGDCYEIIKVGFIDCLEYNRPRVEGIIKSNLKDVDLKFPIITGSDCHEWEAYPYHDKNTKKFNRDFTNFKCLPTFKGLLMSITSFETRVNRRINDNHYIENVSINGNVIPLSNNINVLIGDNGCGKSLIASVLAKSNGKDFYKELIKNNKISAKFDPSLLNNEILFIEQGQIINEVNEGNLFKNEILYKDISTIQTFGTQITDYVNNLCSYVKKNIDINKIFDELSKTDLTLQSYKNDFYFPMIDNNIDFDDEDIDNNRLCEIDKIINSLKTEFKINNKYYENNKIDTKISEVLEGLDWIRNSIFSTYNIKKSNNKVKKIIKDKFTDLNTDLNQKRPTFEKNNIDIVNMFYSFKQTIVKYIKSKFMDNIYPKFPEKLSGCSSKTKNGYIFRKVAKFDNLDLKDDFYKFCFNKNYQNEDAIKAIKNEDDFSNALSGYNYSQLNEFKTNKVKKFIENYSKAKTEILKCSSFETVGHTPGELSLTYYEYKFNEDNQGWKVLIIDQPEDNINPSKIISYLNKFLNALRDTKQIIIVTHNPLLVVNLDVDNVIYVKKLDDEKIEIQSGALEFSSENYSILNLVKNNLDGGYDAIERRLKVYDKNNN